MNEKSIKEWIAKAERDLKIGKDEFATEDPATDERSYLFTTDKSKPR